MVPRKHLPAAVLGIAHRGGRDGCFGPRNCGAFRREFLLLARAVIVVTSLYLPNLWYMGCSPPESPEDAAQDRHEVVNVKTGRKLILATALLSLPLVAPNLDFAGAGESDNGSNSERPVKSELEATFKPSMAGDGVDTTNIEGSAVYEKKRDKKVNRQRFKATIEIPVPTLGISDLATAQSALVEIRLSRGTARYATCSLKLDEFAPDKAEYKVDIRFQEQPGGAPETRERAGSCELTSGVLALAPISGLPVVEVEDSASVVLVTETESRPAETQRTRTETELLTGTFE
jgi:hypothetical protein